MCDEKKKINRKGAGMLRRIFEHVLMMKKVGGQLSIIKLIDKNRG
jgi:hypothetical protein